MGTLTHRNLDGRVKRGGASTNFFIHYEVDDDEVPTALNIDDYDGHEDGAWLLLEAVAEAVEAPVS